MFDVKTLIQRLITHFPHSLYFVSGLFCALLVSVCLHLWIFSAPRIAVVNVTGIMDHFVKLEIQKKQTSEEIKKRAKVFGKTLEGALKEVSKEKNVVIFPREAVIQGAEDLTALIEKRINLSQLSGGL